jgi:hypothetical protein
MALAAVAAFVEDSEAAESAGWTAWPISNSIASCDSGTAASGSEMTQYPSTLSKAAEATNAVHTISRLVCVVVSHEHDRSCRGRGFATITSALYGFKRVANTSSLTSADVESALDNPAAVLPSSDEKVAEVIRPPGKETR